MSILIEAEKHTDIDKIIVDEKNMTVYLEDPEMSIDVGSIGKGYAVEQVCKMVEEKGFKNALISVGGNVRAIGNKGINNEKWKVGIQNPNVKSKEKNIETVSLENISLVTSGDYQRYYTVDGVDYNHIINEKTLMPSEYFKSVTIICKDSGLADALSTAIFNMPFEEGYEFINSINDVEAFWVLKNGEKKYSKGFSYY